MPATSTIPGPVSPEDLEQEVATAYEEIEEVAADAPERALEQLLALPERLRAAPDLLHLRAFLHARLDDLETARTLLRELVGRAPDDADAHHFLAEILEDLDEPEALDHFLRTLALDRLAFDRISPVEQGRLLDEVTTHLQATVQGLPLEFRQRMAQVPLLVEPLPSEYQVEEGLDPRSLGIFEGPDHVGLSMNETFAGPTRIVLFAHNLAAEFPDPEEFVEQIRITVLHEVGHYFGLDEDDMVRLGLD